MWWGQRAVVCVALRSGAPLPAWAWEEQAQERDPSEGHRGEAIGHQRTLAILLASTLPAFSPLGC